MRGEPGNLIMLIPVEDDPKLITISSNPSS
jgi:hypothetical protein